MGEKADSEKIASVLRGYVLLSHAKMLIRVKLARVHREARVAKSVLDTAMLVPESIAVGPYIYKVYLKRTRRQIDIYLIRADVEPLEWLIPIREYKKWLLSRNAFFRVKYGDKL